MASNISRPQGDPQLERPTLRSLGVYWIIQGDDNQNAFIDLAYRKAGSEPWQKGARLFRVERRAHLMEHDESDLQVPDGGWLFAGSVLLLEPGTAYELHLMFEDPDGGKATKTLRASTRHEPPTPTAARVRHVAPGSGGGTGTERDPFLGLAAAEKAAAPGDLFLVGSGVYEGTWAIHRSGTPERPIIWHGQNGGAAIIDAKGHGDAVPGQAISASGSHDVWFEALTVQNATYGIVIHDSARIVVRGCHIRHVEYGLTATRNTQGTAVDHFISDNLMEGPSTWPRTKGIENARGVQITGQGHVVCYNRIRGFADAIDTFPSRRCASIDFHNNELSELTDDGIELDYSERNTRCFHNRLTNVFQGISMQPVYGGPVYVFRNVMYNVAAEPFKLHNSPTGCLIFHNTSVKYGTPTQLWTTEPVRHTLSRNNLYVGTPARYCMDFTAPMKNCDYDYDGFAGGPFQILLRWNGLRYGTLDEVKQRAPVLKHAMLLDARTLFASSIMPPSDAMRSQNTMVDLRLSSRSKAIDAGQTLSGWNDGFRGPRPDLGAYEFGDSMPHYGPRASRRD